MRLPRVPHIVIGFVITIVLAGGSWIASNYSSHSQGALVLLPYQNVNEPFTYVYNPFQGTCGYGAACFSNGCQINTPSSGSCSCTGWKCGAGEKCIIDNTQPAASAFKACGECTKDSECTGGKRCDLSDYKCKNPCSLSNMPACSTKDGTLVTSSLQLQPGASCDLETTPCCVDGFEVTPETFVGFRCLNSTCEQNANEEWKCTAPQQMVACCNQYTGQCRMEPDQTGYCASTADTKHPGQTCDTFTCPKPKGSCCNKVNNTCTADVSQENCAAESMTFNSGMTCEQAACSQNKCPYPQIWNEILQRCMGGQNPQQCNGTYLPVYGCCEEPFQTEEGGVGGMLACCCPQGASCDVPGFSFRCWNSLGGNNPGGTGGINGGGGGDDGGGAGDGGAGGGGNDGGGGDGGGTPGGTSGDIGGTSGQSSPPSTPSTSSLNSSSSTSRSSSSPAPATSSSSPVSSTDGYCCNSDKVCRKGAGCTATLFSCLVECSGTSLSSSSASPRISSSSLSSSSVSVLRSSSSSSSFRSSSSRTSDLSSASSTSSTSFSSVSSGDDSSGSSRSSTSSDISSSRSSSRSSRSSSSSRSSRSSSSSVPTIGGSCRGDECSIGGSQFCGIQNMTCTQTSNFPCIRCVGSSSSIFVAGSCRGDECDMGGDAFCAVQNAACVTSPNFPCIRCIPLAQSSRSSVTIVTLNSSARFFSSATTSRPQLALELTCGDGMQNPGEECDDGNDISGDGCSSSCEREFCGNARLDEGEVCDEGALNSNNPNAPCRLDCTPQRCGDGIIDTPLEICDDGNTRDNDGCSFNCLLERTAPQTLPAQIIELPFTPELPDTNVAYIPPTTTHTPNPPANTDTGPAALAIMISGAAAGYAYMRRRKL